MTEQELAARNERAKGLRVIKPEGEEGYIVESAERDKLYRVQIRDKGSFCTCPDFLTNWDDGDWRCKHIIAVEEVLEMEARRAFDAKPEEGAMKREINRELLEKPFEPGQIKQRKRNHGDFLDYLEAHVVIQRLNDAFEADWSFEVESHEIKEEEVLVLGRLTALGIAKMQFGRSEITRDDTGQEISLGDDLKAAATDALKKCATLFGVGLHLYEERKKPERPAQPKETPNPAPPAASPNERKPRTTDGRLSNKQLGMIYGLGKGQGMASKEIEEKVLQRYGKKPEYLSKSEASEVITLLQQAPNPSSS